MKISFFGLEKDKQSFFLESIRGAELSFFEEKLDEHSVALAKDAEAVCIFVNSEVNKNVIDALPNLKFIATRSTGFDHIDWEYAKAKGIQVSNVPAYGSHTVAEFAFGLILNLSRNLITASNYVKESSDFNYFPPMEGFDLYGKTLGIVGTGKIGKNMVKIAKSFGMNVLAYDLYPDAAFAKENNFEYKSLPELLSQSDIVTLHAPYTKENHHLINKENISTMKKSAYLINTARGELVDVEALVAGLKDKTIAGAGIDVLEKERELKDKNFVTAGGASDADMKIVNLNRELLKMPNAIVTPHIAFYTQEAVTEILKTTAENIQGFISGASVNLVK